MTRKDYVLIAKALNSVYRATSSTSIDAERATGVLIAAQAVADAMNQENANFDRTRFFRAVKGEV